MFVTESIFIIMQILYINFEELKSSFIRHPSEKLMNVYSLDNTFSQSMPKKNQRMPKKMESNSTKITNREVDEISFFT